MYRQTLIRSLIISICFLLVGSITIATDVFSNPLGHPFYSPVPPSDKENRDDDEKVGWIWPDGGKFVDPGCSDIEVIFPKGFFEYEVNAHCNYTELQMQLGSGLLDMGKRFFFGVWSGFGEVDKFNEPLVFRIPYEAQRVPDGMEAKISLYLWDEESGTWYPLDSTVNEDTKEVIAEVDTLSPTRYITGWGGNSLMALVVEVPEPSATYTSTSTLASILTPTFTSTPSFVSNASTKTPALSTPTDAVTSSPTFTPVPVQLANTPPTQPSTFLPQSGCIGILSLGLLLSITVVVQRSQTRKSRN